jgi:uncharacterized RDD family membrane protein YckC
VRHVRPLGLSCVARRLGARAVDAFIVLVVVLVGSLVPGSSESATATTVNFALVALAVSICEGCLVRWWGRTPGAALFGLAITTAEGQRVPAWRATLRAACVWVGLMAGGFVAGALGASILAVALVALIGPMVARDDHRGLHDLIAGTTVSPSSPIDR